MNCPTCQHANRDEARFCTQCGTALVLVCFRCHTPAFEDDLHCAACGSRLPQTGAPVAAIAAPATSGRALPAVQPKPAISMEAERKNVTVLFADLAGFTSISEKMDAEDVTALMNGCLKMLAGIVVRFEGHVDKFIGDCVMAIFGAPIAHENHPELAVRAALQMMREMEDYNTRLPVKVDRKLALHIGINTGMVIAGGMGSDNKMDYTVMGDTVNLAARLESLAKDHQIFASGYTYNQTRNQFDFRRLDPIPVKGKKEPVAVFEVLREKTVRTDDRKAAAATPLVGRTQEIATLKACADRLLAGQSQAVFLISEPGIGKSRVQIEMKSRFKPGEVQIVQGTCQSFSRSVSYYVFGEILKQLLSIDADDVKQAVASKIEQNLPLLLNLPAGRLDAEAREAMACLALMLGTRLDPEYDAPLERMDAQELKVATFRAVAWILRQLSRTKPLMLVLENLHYADTTSIELIGYLFDATKNSAVMLLVLMRPTRDHASAKLPQIARRVLEDRATEVTFARLTDKECDAFVSSLLTAKVVPEPVLAVVRSRADGNPLYIEEIVRGLVDDGTISRSDDGKVKVLRDLSHLSIPGSIQGIIMARIDKLPVAMKDLLNTASVIGQVFRLELLRRLVPAKQLDERLQQLQDMGIIFESQSFPQIEFSFRNILIQEAIYGTLLLKKQKDLHLEVAKIIEELAGDQTEEQAEVLAGHYLGAGDLARALPYLIASGIKAKAAYANEDAAGYLRKALEVAGELAGTPNAPGKTEMTRLRLDLIEVLDLSGDLESAIDAARGAAAMIDEELLRADVIRNIGRIEEKRGLRDQAAKTYDTAFEILKAYPDAVETGRLLTNQSWILNRARKYPEALAKAEMALAIFEKQDARDGMATVLNNLGVITEGQGDLDRALDYNRRSLALFEELGNRRQIGNLFLSLGFLSQKRGETAEALGHFDRAAEMMERIGNRFGAGTALMSKGGCYLKLDRLEDAERALTQALRIHTELDLKNKIIGNEIALAELRLRQGDEEAAVAHLARARPIAAELKFQGDLSRIDALLADIPERRNTSPDRRQAAAGE